MALRTFRHNPSLGGFGGESAALSRRTDDDHDAESGADAFCQIIKELVDNAVDACRTTTQASNKTKNAKVTHATIVHRVRVNLDPATHQDGLEVLRVTVTDTGCGMEDIQTCVDAFQTSKGHNADTNNDEKEQRDSNTSGRYGIGLTLCLLHAQRLVPNSRASIKSATAEQEDWTNVTCVVDTDADSVRCFPGTSLAKATQRESGTSISLLVPGGTAAVVAWPRLAEYFARFQFSLNLNCSLEVMAPSLSRAPLHIRPTTGVFHSVEDPDASLADKTPKKQRPAWRDPLHNNQSGDDGDSNNPTVVTPNDGRVRHRGHKQDEEESKDRLLRAAQQFLERPVLPTNISHSIVPIRLHGIKTSSAPTLEATLIVHGSVDAEEGGNLQESDNAGHSSAEASMMLIRMVNQIPLLDSEEGVACGLVQGVVSKQSLWQAVGLDVSLKVASAATARVPVYTVKDNTQVLPFLKSQQGGVLNNNQANEDEDSSSDSEESIVEAMLEGRKRPRRKSQKRPANLFLPADARLGNVLLIVQINAKPSQLPLPTLSKGRIPQDNKAINQALETALKTCLRKLQTTNPCLFLTARQLRVVERKVCFAPLLSNAVASILSRSRSEAANEALETVQGWDEYASATGDDRDDANDDDNDESRADIDRVGQSIHDRLLILLDQSKKGNRRGRVSDDEKDEVEASEEEGNSQGITDSLDEMFPSASPAVNRQHGEHDSTQEDEEGSHEDLEDEEGLYEDLV